MSKNFLFLAALFVSFSVSAQLQVSKMIGKNSSDYSLGYGGFLKFSYPASDAADITLEAGANIFFEKGDSQYGIATVPVKAGYRYTLNQSGSGFYIEPQVGYNVAGVDGDDQTFKGLVVAGGAGYLFQPGGRIQFDLGLLYERSFHVGGDINYVSLRLTHNFSFKKRDSY